MCLTLRICNVYEHTDSLPKNLLIWVQYDEKCLHYIGKKIVTIFCTIFPHLYLYSEVLKFLNISNCCRSSFSFYHFWALWKREKCERTRLHSSEGRQAIPQKNSNRTERGPWPRNMGRINIETDKEGKCKQRIKQKKKRQRIRSLEWKQNFSNMPCNVFPVSDIAALPGITLAQHWRLQFSITF